MDRPIPVGKIAKHGRSGWIEDLYSRQDIGKYPLDALKKFVARKNFSEHLPGWQSVPAANEEVRQLLLQPRCHQKQREQDVNKQERSERQTDLPSNGWLKKPGDNLQSYGNEGGWALWRTREIDLEQAMGLPPMYRNPA